MKELNKHHPTNFQVNPFYATGLFLYLLKILENLWFSDIFRGYRNRRKVWNGLEKKNNNLTNFLSILLELEEPLLSQTPKARSSRF